MCNEIRIRVRQPSEYMYNASDALSEKGFTRVTSLGTAKRQGKIYTVRAALQVSAV